MNAHKLKTIAKSVVGELTGRLTVGPLACRGKIAILAYHRVVTPDDLRGGYIEPGMFVLRDVFDMQVCWLLQRFEILSFSQLLTRWNTNEWDERKAYCVLTFDDGWLDNYRNAFPILKKYKVPATIFLPTNYIGTNEWFWTEKIAFLLNSLGQPYVTATQRNRVGRMIAGLPNLIRSESVGQECIGRISIGNVIGQCKLLSPSEIEKFLIRLGETLEVSIPHERVTVNWSEVDEMAKSGISFGSHSCSHHLLTRLNKENIRQEIQESERVLRTLTEGYVPVFCYPNGANDSEIQHVVNQSHYEAAVGTRNGVEGVHPKNMYELNRIGMHNDITRTPPLLSFHLFRAALGL